MRKGQDAVSLLAHVAECWVDRQGLYMVVQRKPF
jgi:hypothetical protein